MNREHRYKRGGFTITEVVVASALTVIAVMMAVTGFVYIYRGVREKGLQDELDINVQIAMERLKRDLRLSSLDKMFFYPAGAGPYTAVSFPLAADTNGDGAVDLGPDGKIAWDKTVIYHRWTVTPEQLRMTTFHPRGTNLTDAQMQAQLDTVVTTGYGTGVGATTTVVFANLFNWEIQPRAGYYDAYSDTTSRVVNVVLGSCLISNGVNTIQFTSVGTSGSGYKIGVDSLFMSPSYSRREAEAQTVSAQSGASASAMYMPMGSWGGNYQLCFPATASGHYFRLSIENDRWEETNFRATGETCSNTTVVFDQTLSPMDYVVLLEGNDTNWFAYKQTGDPAGFSPSDDTFKGYAIRVLIRGQGMANGGWLSYNGAKCKVNLRAGDIFTKKLKIEAAYIGECAAGGMDVVIGANYPLTFPGGYPVTIHGTSNAWSDLASFPIDKTKSYLVTLKVKDEGTMGNPWCWAEMIDSNAVGSYIITNATVADATDASWSVKTNVYSTNRVYGVQYLFTTYPSNGTYISQIFDTQQEDPSYSAIDWSADVASGCSNFMQVRAGDSNDLSDAAAWSGVSVMASPGSINPGAGRYVQFRANLLSNPTNYNCTPKLKSVTTKWAGVARITDVGGTFTTGPDYGIVEVKVNGAALKQGLTVDLEIFENTLGHGGSKEVTSRLKSEIVPRNTGK